MSKINPFMTPSNIYVELFAKIVSNVHSRPLAILLKVSIWDAWVGPECTSAGGYNIALKV